MANKKIYTGVEYKSDVIIGTATPNTVPVVDANGKIISSPISNTELGQLSGITSGVQSQIDTKAADAIVIKKDGSVAFTAAQSMGGNKLTNLAPPTADSDAATKSYVDALKQALDIKDSVRVASVANVALSASALSAGLSVDGIALAEGDRVLLKNQTAGAENGIYVYSQTGTSPSISYTLTRSSDADSSDEVTSGMFTFISEGTHSGAGYVLTSPDPITLGTTALSFTQFSGAGQIEAGAGLSKSGNTLNINVDGQGLEIVSDQLTLELDGTTLSKSATGLKLGDTTVVAGSYGSASQSLSVAVDAQGRLTSAAAQSIAIASTQVTDFVEASQDAIGASLLDTASVDLTYDDAANKISAAVLPAGVDHDALANYVANKHVDHSTVSIATAANSGLAGGGDITATRNLLVDINGTTAETSAAIDDKVLVHDVSAAALRSMSRKDFVGASAGDIKETSFALANNVTVAANVTGFLFGANVRSFDALVSVEIDGTADLYESFRLLGVKRGTDFQMSIEGVGDNSGVAFSITSAGQIQYTSSNVAGFVAGSIKFRAVVTSA